MNFEALANQIVTALRTGASTVLVTGVPPAARHSLSTALCNVTEPRCAVIDISCGPELTSDELSRAGSVVATLPISDGAAAVSETSVPLSLLVVFDDVDHLSELQLGEIFAFVEQSAHKRTAAVLLASSEFLTRLESPSLQFLNDRLAARLEFHEIRRDERIEFLQRQLTARREADQTRGIWHGGFRILGAACVFLTAGIAAFWLVGTGGSIHEPATSPATDDSSTGKQSVELSIVNETPADVTRAMQSARVPPGMPPVAATDQFNSVPETNAFTGPSAAQGQSKTRQATSPAFSLFPAGNQVNHAQHEIAALVARGDSFIGAGDIASARLFYERAAEAGSGSAALRLGATFDPSFLAQAGVRGIFSNRVLALSWYRRARDLGNPAATNRLKVLEQQDPDEPQG